MSTETKSLEQRAEELREIVSGPTRGRLQAKAELAAIKRQQAERRTAADQEKARARLIVVKRAYNEVLKTEYPRDVERYRRAVSDGWEGWKGRPVSVSEAAEMINSRFKQLFKLWTETRDLCKDFGLQMPAYADLKSAERPQPPADLLRDVASSRVANMHDYISMVRRHQTRTEE